MFCACWNLLQREHRNAIHQLYKLHNTWDMSQHESMVRWRLAAVACFAHGSVGLIGVGFTLWHRLCNKCCNGLVLLWVSLQSCSGCVMAIVLQERCST